MWELPAGAAAAWLCVALLALPLGRGCAAWLFGGGWTWSQGPGALRRSIGGLLTGRPEAGLIAGASAQLPGDWAVYAVVLVFEGLLLAATVWAVVLWWRYLGPGARNGLASRAEAALVLGAGRLRKSRRLNRPDLYGPEAGTAGRVPR
jgi:type IV secretion system protein VirD4